eukprot:TRINITY_DN176_c0_g3_i1.p1 TRINITY_DN176_c0_g3~~TRINITY_DN176_c0_g3_i1.p1  ORF type:complete len:618 (+),score=28.48 TRINITY_DN176_c0_g3_i1:63-1856(+)
MAKLSPFVFASLMSVFILSTSSSSADSVELLNNFEDLENLILGAQSSAELPAFELVEVSTLEGKYLVDRVDGIGGVNWLRARGIQYAEHPVGPLRWQPPVPKKPDLLNIIDATRWGHDCVQGPFLSRLEAIKTHTMSESCLYLNVWAPHDVIEGRTYPVLVWFHGGSFTTGGSTSYNGDGIFSYRQDVVLVTVNYRLGALGFLGGRAISDDTIDGSSGNFGLQDTRVALKWVQRNIVSFRGDPGRVTIFGESSGSSLVETHLAASRSNGLFQYAIMQSGAFDNYTVQVDPDDVFNSFARVAGCDPTAKGVLRCLRSMPLFAADLSTSRGLMRAISNTSRAGVFGPAIDGVELEESPERSAMEGRLNKVVAAIIGTTRDEARYLMPSQMPVNNGPQATRVDLQKWLETYYSHAASAITEVYSGALNVLSPWATAADIFTDSQYLCPTQRSARWLAAAGANVFVYNLAYQPSVFEAAARIVFQKAWCSDYSRCENVSKVDPGVGHGADVYLVFNDPGLNATDIAVGHTMIDYWLNFATFGTPSSRGAKVAEWPTFLPGNITMSLAHPSMHLANLRRSYCDFWDSLNKQGKPREDVSVFV